MIFSSITSKIFGGVAAVALAGLVVQTVRIEGAFCRDVAVGEKPQCVFNGFKQDLNIVRIDLVDARERTKQEIRNHQETKEAYKTAQKEAALLEAKRLETVVSKQKEITNDIRKVYQDRINQLRVTYDSRLRNNSKIGERLGGTTHDFPVSVISNSSRRTDGQASENGLLLDERLEASIYTTQLNSLISWILRQQKVDPNNDSSS